jgi:hypothetical protein
MGNSTRPRRIGLDENEVDKKGFLECGDMHSLVTIVKIGLITQPIQNLRGSNVHDTETTKPKY